MFSMVPGSKRRRDTDVEKKNSLAVVHPAGNIFILASTEAFRTLLYLDHSDPAVFLKDPEAKHSFVGMQ